MRIAAARLALMLVWGGIPAASHAAPPPELESWLLNTSGQTGYGGLPANVQRIRYSSGNAYVNASDIPTYTIGPWPGNPNTPTDQGYLFRIPRNPVENGGTKTSTPLGPTGVWINGVVVFNALDAHSYNNQNVWHQNAVLAEAASFDACLGHPAPGGVYHHHQNPACLYSPDSTKHSPIYGYAYDGFPIYGPYGHRNADGTGGIARMRSSYRQRNITQRTTLPDGTVLSPSQYGPDVSATYPLGFYVEDFEYVGGLGDLDRYNGRFTVTPEYPGGIYAYFVTIEGTGASAYPYTIGPQYYGVVAADDISTHGHVTITEPVSDYTATWAQVPAPRPGGVALGLDQNAPNRLRDGATISFRLPAAGRATIDLYDLAGRFIGTVFDGERPAGTNSVWLDGARLGPGAYFYRLSTNGRRLEKKMVLSR